MVCANPNWERTVYAIIHLQTAALVHIWWKKNKFLAPPKFNLQLCPLAFLNKSISYCVFVAQTRKIQQNADLLGRERMVLFMWTSFLNKLSRMTTEKSVHFGCLHLCHVCFGYPGLGSWLLLLCPTLCHVYLISKAFTNCLVWPHNSM